jgi:peptidyl-prolyl cis-trans isomerase SurA
MKYLSLTLALAFFFFQGEAQTLFTYGPHRVSSAEFLRAFRKNNPDTGNYRQAITEYLDLYTRFRLKVQAAYDARMDTLPNQKADEAGFRRQIEQGYMTDTASFNRLVQEAWERSRRDISISHIFIPFRRDFASNPYSRDAASREDSLAAMARVRDLQARLNAGESFETLALVYSADPDVKVQKGYLGYITVFTLPYALENAAYGLHDQQVSDPVMTGLGYHILKKRGERPARGRVKVSQILIAVAPGADAAQQEHARRLADSVYQAIRQGGSFEQLAIRFSHDRNSFANGGLLPEFGVGQYSPAFEEQAFALRDSGSVSAPFESTYGFHILKKLGATPVETDKNLGLVQYRAMVQEDRRNDFAKTRFERALLPRIGYRKAIFREADLWNITDTFILQEKLVRSGIIQPGTVLFNFTKEKALVSEWVLYARDNGAEGGRKGYPALFDAYLRDRSVEYYRKHLEDFDPAFRAQLKEFRDGNLLFEIMEKQVWSRAAMDTAGLRKHYEANRDKYAWGPSADAVLIHATDLRTANEAFMALQKNPAAWQRQVDVSEGRLMADSGRFELMQLGSVNGSNLKAGSFTGMQADDTDGTQSFAYIVNVYPNASPRSYSEARGLVMNDYQRTLEDQWVGSLRKKYPVVVNKTEWEKVLRRR